MGLALAARTPVSLAVGWFLPAGRFAVGLDPLSAVFLVPIFLVPALGSVYGLEYWPQAQHPENGRKLSFFYGLLAGAMALVVIARNGVLFLIVWEVMAMASFFAATAEDDDPAVRSAGWVYLVATHIGTLCLIAMFALWKHATGTYMFGMPSTGNWAATTQADAMPLGLAGAIFVLALIGFGCKAGLMPLHVWLPGTHANAPSHVSAVMSGVMLKMGVYGIVRMAGVLPVGPSWWGGVVLGVGAATGVLGIAMALGQGDLKRLLAYSSIENIGIILMGVGLAVLGRTYHRPEWVLLGLGGALLHVWNHGLFKSLLFLNAGSVMHAAHTRAIDRLGGLGSRMPRTAGLFLLGAVAICALPPLNGFVSEWLIYLGLLHTVAPGNSPGIPPGTAPGLPVAALGAVALAMIGALAAACFVKLLGAAFLGTPRTAAAEHAHDPRKTMLGPMIVLAAGCILLGLAPWLAAPLLERVATGWSGELVPAGTAIQALAPLTSISLAAGGLIAGTGVLLVLLYQMLKRRTVARAGTWDCGYARPTARMQYTGSSFAQFLMSLWTWALWPQIERPQVAGLFPPAPGAAEVAGKTPARIAGAGAGARFAMFLPDTILERLVLPTFRLANRLLPKLRLLQQGRIQIYVIYFLGIVLLLLLWGRIGF